MPDMIPNVGAAARHPGHVVGYSKQNPVAGALLIWVALVGIAGVAQAARTGRLQLPDRTAWVPLGVASIVVVIAASFAPRLVTWLLLAVLVVQVATNASGVATLAQRGFAAVQRAVPRGA